MNNENTKMNCPKCGAEEIRSQPWNYICGTMLGLDEDVASQGNECKEREAHNETKRELEKWQSLAAQYSAGREHNALMAEMWRSVASEFRKSIYYQFGNDPAAWPERAAKALKTFEEACK